VWSWQSYINQDGNKITSCWRTNKQGVIQITKIRMSEWEERINILNQQIQYWIDNKTNKTIEIIQLFYDN
jgi:transcriptional regulator CtsR